MYSWESSFGVETLWHPFMDEYVPWRYLRIVSEKLAYPNELYTIKISHAGWDLGFGSWEKHMHDCDFLKSKGMTVIQPLYDVLVRVWQDVHGRKKVNLTQDKASFFDDAVTRIYDHDSIHESVAYGDRPLYESVMKDDASVQTDMVKVRGLTCEQQLRLYREEIYATALERWVIPSDYRCSPTQAYARALKKTIVSLTKGWSTQFLAENYGALRRPDMDYVARHLSRQDRLIRLESNA
jgi:hypothetical protein